MKGYFFVQMAGLTAERKERLLSSVSTDGDPYEVLRKNAGRLFEDIHSGERAQQPSGKGFRPRGVNETSLDTSIAAVAGNGQYSGP